MAASPLDPAIEAVRAAYTAPYVLPAVNAAAEFWDSIATGRIGRAKFLDATALLFFALTAGGPKFLLAFRLPRSSSGRGSSGSNSRGSRPCYLTAAATAGETASGTCGGPDCDQGANACAGCVTRRGVSSGSCGSCGSTRFGAHPLQTVRPARMSLLVHLCPELEAEDPETLVGPRATLELLKARVFRLKKTLTEWQNFMALVDPAFVTTDF
ncbi:hypothetical protein CYMTET_51006 [Cymbomonas tetramitiformis]|uniref:Uncharacterized protein n=1 Tax=Cymbomonas tetramitiformis TaxID=36881 RepID=A0AAE0BLZ6_9CHLO|nr:hypothetical protein CYMTET_51006 [Cymbomonas tetramitiformis]